MQFHTMNAEHLLCNGVVKKYSGTETNTQWSTNNKTVIFHAASEIPKKKAKENHYHSNGKRSKCNKFADIVTGE